MSDVFQYTGVLGAFNCQGGGWSPQARKNKCVSEYSRTITAKAKPVDVEWNNRESLIPIQAVKLFALYSYCAKNLVLLKLEEDFEVNLDPFN